MAASKSSSPVAIAVNALQAATCPWPAALVAAFQAAYAAVYPTFTFTSGVFDDATVAAYYNAVGQSPPCPSTQLIALAQAVLADTTVCAGNPNTNISAFMASYASWMNPDPTLLATPVSVFDSTVQDAVTKVLGPSAVLCPRESTTPAPGGSTTATPAAAATSNVGLYVGGAVAVAAIGALAYAMSARKVVAGVMSGARKNPVLPGSAGSDRKYKRALLHSIQGGTKSAVILRLQGRIADATRIERAVDRAAREAELRGWADEVIEAEERGRLEGERAVRAAASR
jgi:hypothetical protein